MIFVTVGTQLGFDRLIKFVDIWAQKNPTVDVFCQISQGTYYPRHCNYSKDLTSEEFEKKFKDSQVVVAHAGMGSIISALEFQKPLIIMPREYKYGEHRNDHQISTVEKYLDKEGLYFCQDYDSLSDKLNSIDSLVSCSNSTNVSSLLIKEIKQFLNEI
jgi:UDP-N-acetylglucosamine transferase subunit ALG13